MISQNNETNTDPETKEDTLIINESYSKNVSVLREYEKRVVDLSRRNRLLKYPKKGRAINFTLTPDEFFGRFGDAEDLKVPIIHKEILDAEAIEKQKENNQLPLVPSDNEEILDQPFEPFTDLKGEKLLNTLQALRLDTKRKYEEHGLHVLYLTIGSVSWKDPQVGRKGSNNVVEEYDYTAPIFLIPVSIKEQRLPSKSTSIQSALDFGDIVVNPVLRLLITEQYNAKEISVPENIDDIPSILNRVKKEIVDVFSEVNIKCDCFDNIKLGQYSFYGQQIYEDIKKNEEAILSNEFIKGLCGDGQIAQEDMSISIDNPDNLLSLKEDFSVMDADASQLKVIEKSINGNHLVIQGPPGTGKSQTIVNLVSNFLARNKTILVVCEKQVALEVVYDRLKKSGLDKLCLPLFSQKTDKASFAKNILNDVNQIIRDETIINANRDIKLSDRENQIKRLRGYAEALKDVVEPFGKNTFWFHGELSSVQSKNQDSCPVIWGGGDPLEMTYVGYRNLCEVFNSLEPVFNLPKDEDHSHWKNIRRVNFTADFTDRVTHTLDVIKDEIKFIGDHLSEHTNSMQSTREILGTKINNEYKTEIVSSQVRINEKADFNRILTSLLRLEGSVGFYIDMSKKLNDRFSIPRKKENVSLETKGVLKDDSNISEILAMSEQYEITSSIFQTCIEKLESGVDNYKDFFDNFDTAELICNEDLLSVNPLVTKFVNWKNFSDISDYLEKLRGFDSLYSHYIKSKNTLDKWAILPSSLVEKGANDICDNFEQTYGSLLRRFGNGYKKDLGSIASLCNTRIPKGFGQYLEIARAVKSVCRLSEKIKTNWDEFLNSSIKEGTNISIHDISHVKSQFEILLNWLKKNNKQEIPEHLANILQSTKNNEILPGLIKSCTEADKILAKTSHLFVSGNETKVTVASISCLNGRFNEVSAAVASIKLANASLSDNLVNSPMPQDLAQLNDFTRDLNSLIDAQNKIVDSYLDEEIKSSPEDLINQFDSLQELIKHFKCLRTIQVNTVNNVDKKEDSTLADVFEYIDKLIEIMPVSANHFANYEAKLNELGDLFENSRSISNFEEYPFTKHIETIKSMLNDREGLYQWTQYQSYVDQLKQMGQEWFIKNTAEIYLNTPAAVFAQSFLNAWLESRYASNLSLKCFNPYDHRRIIDSFKRLDREIAQINSQRIYQQRFSEIIRTFKSVGSQANRTLMHEAQKKRAHLTVRKLVSQCSSQVQCYKPCWMMSPLTLTSYIPYGKTEFDVVIFDEASQMRVEHAIGAIARAKQVITFGDENQLPPTSFFELSDTENEDDEAWDQANFESLIQACREVLPGADISLLYHYRSKSESLIAFSNFYIYNNELITFPNPDTIDSAVEFKYVEKGIFSGRRNNQEADQVANQCVEIITQFPGKSLGVIAFSKEQESAIREALDRIFKEKPALREKLNETSEESDCFFVKNLESVQGDERDIIVMSVGYGPDVNGNIYKRFGPINSSNGFRRLNVAITRAKEKMYIFSSMKFSDIGAVDSSSRGVRLLQQYLEYSESGIKSLLGSKITKGDTGAEEDSPFEVDVRMELEKRGLIVHKQVGVSGFKIDLAIVNPKNENEYILGIECDGATYHSSYSARVNDRLRQDVLENLGWKIYRIWSQHWITHRSEIIEDIIRNIELYKNTLKKEEVLVEERIENLNVEPVEQTLGGHQDEVEERLPNNLIEIDSNQAIEILNISRGTFSIWMREKKLKPTRRIGRRWFFDKVAVEKIKENVIDNSVEIDSNQAIEILNISRGTFSVWMREKKLKPIRRIGNRWIFDKETIENLGRIE